MPRRRTTSMGSMTVRQAAQRRWSHSLEVEVPGDLYAWLAERAEEWDTTPEGFMVECVEAIMLREGASGQGHLV